MRWNLIDYDSYPGRFNMDFDIGMIRDFDGNTPTLRFYGWDPHCISLGANQSIEEIDKNIAEKHNLDVVKRPTGGRAILHAEELTYSVVMPNKYFSARILYEKISTAIVEGLINLHPALLNVELETNNPQFGDLLKKPSGSICFASTAKSEIKYFGKKLVGSAQRKFNNVTLQHGSILIGDKHKEIVNYLKISENEKISISKEVGEKTIELEKITGQEIDIIELQDSIIAGFNKILGAEFIKETAAAC